MKQASSLSLLIVLICFFLSGCNKSALEELLIEKGMISPSIDDIQYGNVALSGILQELTSIEYSDDLLSQEYKWVKERNFICSSSEIAKKDCTNSANKKHELKLLQALARKLWSLPVPATLQDNKSTIAGNIALQPQISQVKNFRFILAYSPKPNRAAQTLPDKKIQIVDLTNGKIVSSFLYPDPDEKKALGSLRLSDNGKLLLASYKRDSYLLSAESGRVLFKITHSEGGAYFTNKDRYILARSFTELRLYDVTSGELTLSSAPLLRSFNEYSYNKKTNEIALWGFQADFIGRVLLPFNDPTRFSQLEQYLSPAPNSSSDYVELLDNNKAIIFQNGKMYEFDSKSQEYRLILDIGFLGSSSVKTFFVVNNDHIYLHHSTNSKSGYITLRVVNRMTGLSALKKLKGNNVILETGIDNTFLTYESGNLKFVTIAPEKLNFKKHNPAKEEKALLWGNPKHKKKSIRKVRYPITGDLHAVGVYEGDKTYERKKGQFKIGNGSNRHSQEVKINIGNYSEKITLVLTSFKPVTWIIEGNVNKVRKVLLSISGNSSIQGIDSSLVQKATLIPNYKPVGTSEYKVFEKSITQLTGKSLKSFTGGYTGKVFHIAPPGKTQDNSNKIFKWVDEKGRVHFGDKMN